MMQAQMFSYKGWLKVTNPVILIEAFNALLRDSGFGVLEYVDQEFEKPEDWPYEHPGYTGLWLLSESHFAFHTFPEEGATYFELSSCVKDQYDKFKVLNHLYWQEDGENLIDRSESGVYHLIGDNESAT